MLRDEKIKWLDILLVFKLLILQEEFDVISIFILELKLRQKCLKSLASYSTVTEYRDNKRLQDRALFSIYFCSLFMQLLN